MIRDVNRKGSEFFPVGGALSPVGYVGVRLATILSVLIGLRPLSEILWRHKFIGANLQSHLTIILFIISCILLFNKKSIQKKYLLIYITVGFFISFIFLSSIFNFSEILFLESLKTITSFTIGLAVLSVLPMNNIRLLLVLFGISILVLTIVSYLQYFGFCEFNYFTGSVVKGKSIGRVSGGLSHPNDLNRSLVFFIFTLFFLLPRISIYLRLGGILFFVPPIFWTYHRVTYLIVFIIIFLCLLYIRKYYLLGIGLLLLSFIVFINIDWILFFVFEKRLNFSRGLESSRFWYSYESIRLFSEAPFWHKLFGSGIFPCGRKHGDGDLPRILYAYGVIGLFAYFSVLLSVLGLFLKNFVRNSVFFCSCLFCIWMVFSLFTDVARYPAFIIMFFVCLRYALHLIEIRCGY